MDIIKSRQHEAAPPLKRDESEVRREDVKAPKTGKEPRLWTPVQEGQLVIWLESTFGVAFWLSPDRTSHSLRNKDKQPL